MKWATAGGGGKVLQVVTAASSGYIAVTGINTYADSNLSVTITPTASTSRILILVSQAIGLYTNTATQPNLAWAKILRGTTTIWQSDAGGVGTENATGPFQVGRGNHTISLHYVDSPSTTSATTYKVQWKQTNDSYDHTIYCNLGGYPSQITVLEIGA